MAEDNPVIEENLELQMLVNNKEVGFKYRERREDNWRENYELYRDNVTVNRLIQRQTVHLPLMKTVVRTVLKDIDEMPVIEFENRDNDKEAEVLENEYWKWTLEQNNAEIQDIVDKKQDIFFGRTFDSWQIEDGRIVFDIEDPEDMLVDRFLNPYDIDSSRFLIHTHVFVPLVSLKNNPDYDQDAIADLEEFFMSEQGIIKATDNQNSLQKKNQKMTDMGDTEANDPVLGETYVELTLHYVFRPADEEWTDFNTGEKHKTDEEQIYHYVEAENMVILLKKPQEKIIGVTQDNFWRSHYRYNSWGDDIDNQDFWTDGFADIVRPNNKILDAWFSQLVENRTLRNFGMHYYDSSIQADGFTPSTFNPVPWGWYPVPGKPSEVLQKVEIPDLSESLDEMDYVTNMVQKATASTDTQQGTITPGNNTKFEINAALNEAQKRIQGLSKFYTKAWEQRATKFLKLIEAAPDKLDVIKIYVKGKNTDDLYAKEIAPKDWMTKSGYRIKVWSQDEKKAKDKEKLANLQALVVAMFDNPEVQDIYKRNLAEMADLTPDEISRIMEFEDRKKLAMQNGTILGEQQAGMALNQGGGGNPSITPPPPAQPAPPPAQ